MVVADMGYDSGKRVNLFSTGNMYWLLLVGVGVVRRCIYGYVLDLPEGKAIF